MPTMTDTRVLPSYIMGDWWDATTGTPTFTAYRYVGTDD